MRVAIVALGPLRAGMLHYTSLLANALAPLVDVTVFTPQVPDLEAYLVPGVRFEALDPLNVPGHLFPTLARQGNPVIHLRNAARIRALRPDVVHFTTDHVCNALLRRLLGDVRVCFTHHDPTRHPGEASSLRERLTHLMATRSDRVIVHAQALAKELTDRGLQPERLAVIPHGDYGFLENLCKGAAEEPMILCFGRFVEYKGLDILCRAERFLARNLKEYRICIAGEGDASSFAAEIAPGARIEVINEYLSDAAVADLFERCRVAVLPYTQASQSGVLAIALAFGKPVVVTDVGGLPEAVGFGKAGLIVPPGDPAALAKAIERLWRDPDLRRSLGDAARRHAVAEIGWPGIAERHFSLYVEAIASAGATDAIA